MKEESAVYAFPFKSTFTLNWEISYLGYNLYFKDTKYSFQNYAYQSAGLWNTHE